MTRSGDLDVCTHRAHVRVARPRCAHPLRAGEGNSPAPPLIWPYPSLTRGSSLALPLRQFVAASEDILGLVGPKAKTPHREESVGPRPPNIDLFLPDGYGAA